MGKKKARGPKRVTAWEAYVTIVNTEQTTFSESEREIFFSSTKRSEGPGERSYRRKFGLDEDAAGPAMGRDVPELGDREIKSVYSRSASGKDQISTIRAGAVACKMVDIVRVRLGIELERMGRGDDEKMITMLSGTFSKKSTGALPEKMRQIIWDHIKPSSGLRECVGGIECVSPVGHMLVKPHDYDAAFDVAKVSKGLVSYRLKRDYLLSRIDISRSVVSELRRTSEHRPDHVNVLTNEGAGHL